MANSLEHPVSKDTPGLENEGVGRNLRRLNPMVLFPRPKGADLEEIKEGAFFSGSLGAGEVHGEFDIDRKLEKIR